MVSVLETPSEAGHILLRDVSWNTYQCLLDDYQDRDSPRMTYSKGALEIMSPSPRHEMWNRRLALIITIVATEWDIDARDFGSTTFKRADLESGFEPDSCFYIQNADRMVNPDRIDLEAGALPPDLVVEIDITSPSLAKLPLFARIGIPEVWRVDASGTVTFHMLANGGYGVVAQSRALPLLTVDAANMLLAMSIDLPPAAWQRRVRQWAVDSKAGA